MVFQTKSRAISNAEHRVVDDPKPEIENELEKTKMALKESQRRVEELEMHISELVMARELEGRLLKRIREESKNKSTLKESEIQTLKEQNATLLEETHKVKEAMSIMKEVFTRNQKQENEEKETIALLNEERNLLLEENERLRQVKSNRGIPDSQKNASVLAKSLEAARAELADYRLAQKKSEKTIRNLKVQLKESKDLSGNDNVENMSEVERRVLLDRLERQVMKLVEGRDDDDDDDIDENTVAMTKLMIKEEIDRIRGFARNFCVTL